MQYMNYWNACIEQVIYLKIASENTQYGGHYICLDHTKNGRQLQKLHVIICLFLSVSCHQIRATMLNYFISLVYQCHTVVSPIAWKTK